MQHQDQVGGQVGIWGGNYPRGQLGQWETFVVVSKKCVGVRHSGQIWNCMRHHIRQHIVLSLCVKIFWWG
jgi:hypothetical protein